MTEGKKYLPPEEPAPRTPHGVPLNGRPMAPKTVTYTRQWLRYLQVGMLLVAWLVPAIYLLNQMLWPPVKRGAPTADCFIALDYTGISDTKSNEVKSAVFKQHIKTLIKNGYTPITLTEARDLVKLGKPVPPKSILLTMDHSRKTSFYGAKGTLRYNGWNAVMFLWTRPISEADPSMLLWPYVRELVHEKNWEIGAQSENGFAHIPVEYSGKTGHFMTSPMWLENERRLETLQELAQRVEMDHQQCLSNIVANTGVRPIAYAYPYGDFGQFQRQKELVKRINLDAVSRHYDMAFLTGKFGLTTRNSDPRRLNRLQVQPDWTPQDLVDRIDRMWPQMGTIALTNAEEAALSWTTDWGVLGFRQKHIQKHIILTSSLNDGTGRMVPGANATTEEHDDVRGQLVLEASENITGARTWLAGSDQRQDLYMRLTFQLDYGQMGVFLHATPDEERYIYLGLDTSGGVWLRQKHAGLEPFTLASTKTHMKKEDNVLEIFIRGALFGALLNGQPLFKENVPMLRGAPESGMIGLSVWDTQKQRAMLEISELIMSPQVPAVATWREGDTREPFYTRWIHQNGFRLTHLAPVWLSLSSAGGLSQVASDQMLTTALARLYRLKLLPRVEIKSEHFSTALSPAQLAYRLNEIKADGLYLDFSQLPAIKATALTDWLQKMLVAFKDQTFQVIVQVPKSLENPAGMQPILAIMPNLQLAVSSDSAIAQQGLPGALKPPLITEPIPEPTSSNTVPFVYQGKDQRSERNLTLPEKIRIWRDEGRAAMTANRFDAATNAWTLWHSSDPDNYEPLMNMGDCFLHRGEIRPALDYFTKALDLDPSKIGLAMRRIHYLEEIGEHTNAVTELDKYARIFPENTEVLMAQAEQCVRDGRVEHGRILIKKAVSLKPGDVDVLVNAVRKSPTKVDRRTYLRQIAALGRQPDTQLEFGDALEKQDLLALPDAYLLLPTIQQILANTNTEPQVREAFSHFRVLTDPVLEHFTVGGLSDNWLVDGGEAMPDARGSLMLKMSEGRHELALRLRGSELFQNGFIETEVRGHSGEIWLLARRGNSDYIRLGFDQNSMLFLQVWKDGQRVANLRRQYTQLSQAVKLRLHVRGNGAMGFVNGQPAFESPVMMPQDMGYGSWGLTLNSPQPGRAQARLGMLSCGPLPFLEALFPPLVDAGAQSNLLETCKSVSRDLSAMAPRWYHQVADAQYERRAGLEDELIATLARFYGVKLLPAVEMGGSEPNTNAIQNLITIATTNRYNGFTLFMDMMPSAKLIEQAEVLLENTAFDFLYVVRDLKGEHADIRGVGNAERLFLTSTNLFNMVYLERGATLNNSLLNGRDNLLLVLHQTAPTNSDQSVGATNLPPRSQPSMTTTPAATSLAPVINTPSLMPIVPDQGPALPLLLATNAMQVLTNGASLMPVLSQPLDTILTNMPGPIMPGNTGQPPATVPVAPDLLSSNGAARRAP